MASGNEIPIGSKILCVADSYDAMVNDRPYRKAMSKKEALNELRRCAGTQFDKKVGCFYSNQPFLYLPFKCILLSFTVACLLPFAKIGVVNNDTAIIVNTNV